MDAQKYIRRLFSYDRWANEEVANVLLRLPSPPAKSVRWLAHIAAAERLWLERLEGQSPTIAVWPDFQVPECHRQLQEMARLWSRYLDGLGPEGLLAPVTYKNSKGEIWKSAVEDVLMHVTTHSAYHRGQIAADMRSSGATPAYTDYIHGVRQGLVE